MEESMETHSSLLAWRTPWMEQPAGLQSTGSQKGKRDWSDWACTYIWTHKRERCSIGKMVLKSSLLQKVRYYRTDGLFLTCRVGNSDTSEIVEITSWSARSFPTHKWYQMIQSYQLRSVVIYALLLKEWSLIWTISRKGKPSLLLQTWIHWIQYNCLHIID